MKNKQTRGFIIIIIIGAGLLIAGIAVQINSSNFAKNAKEATASITRIDTEYDTDSDGDTTTTHRVFVEFEVAGKNYSGELGYYSVGMYEGGTVIVLYNTDNPQNFRSKSGDAFGFILLLILGSICLIVGIISLLNRGKKKTRNPFFMRNRKQVFADVTGIVQGKTQIRNRPSYNIICEYKDEASGGTYLFRSEDIWVPIPPFDENIKYPQIAVYVDNDDWGKYQVDSNNWLNEAVPVLWTNSP